MYLILLQMDFSKINNVGSGEFLVKKSLTDLTVNTFYQVTSLRKVKTMYGSRIVVSLNDEFQIFLPTRFFSYFDQEHQQFQDMQEEIKQDRLYIKSGCPILISRSNYLENEGPYQKICKTKVSWFHGGHRLMTF